MKNPLYFLALLLLCACGNDTAQTNNNTNTSDTKEINSPLVFNMDYGDWQLNTPKKFKDFENLFEKSEIIQVANIDITNGTSKIYDFHQGLGEVQISKKKDGKYHLVEYYIVPIGSVYGKVALLCYALDAATGAIARDLDFQPQLQVYKYWYNHIVKEYDSHLKDLTYTAKDWKKVPHDAYDEMRFLMFNLTLAAIEGCKECEERMTRITEDYSFVQAAEYGQNLLVCNAILKKFKG